MQPMTSWLAAVEREEVRVFKDWMVDTLGPQLAPARS